MPQVQLAALFRAPAALALTLAAVMPNAAAQEPVVIAPVTVIVVRHAEKVDDSRDPALSEAGIERAGALAEALEHAGLDAAYASQYQRTRQTAMPAAEAAGLAVQVDRVDADIPAWAQGFAAEVVRQNPGKTVLVAGHSNTVPPLVAALCRCEVESLTDGDYDRLFIINDAGGQDPSLIIARYGASGPG